MVEIFPACIIRCFIVPEIQWLINFILWPRHGIIVEGIVIHCTVLSNRVHYVSVSGQITSRNHKLKSQIQKTSYGKEESSMTLLNYLSHALLYGTFRNVKSVFLTQIWQNEVCNATATSGFRERKNKIKLSQFFCVEYYMMLQQGSRRYGFISVAQVCGFYQLLRMFLSTSKQHYRQICNVFFCFVFDMQKFYKIKTISFLALYVTIKHSNFPKCCSISDHRMYGHLGSAWSKAKILALYQGGNGLPGSPFTLTNPLSIPAHFPLSFIW